MVAYSFKQQFVAPILSGAKCQTIRADRKRHARAGEEMQLYTGMRTKQCRLIARVTCIGASLICLDFADNLVHTKDFMETPVQPKGVFARDWRNIEDFARCDGFESWCEMRKFWEANHPGVDRFFGVLIRWAGLTNP